MEDLNTYYPQIYHWFPDIPKTESDKLVIRKFEAGEVLALKGQLFQHIFIVLDGVCNVINQLDNGTEILTLKLALGDVIGVSESVLNNMRYIASVKACTPVIVAELSQSMFQRWINTYPCFVNFVLKNLVTRLHYTADFSANCQTSASKINLAKYLIDRYNVELTFLSPNSRRSVRIQETHEMIGTFLGVSSRTVERQLHALKADGLISTSRGKIDISPEQYQELLNLVASNL
ncbi:MAG: Crp/Fnr family transcriptional regulator [Lachnospiraceae bacterium]|nr:Crp/Fnr family transcriptional regulator [Lachnospiraceae bacterium]